MDTLRIFVSGVTDAMPLERNALARGIQSLLVKSAAVQVEYSDAFADRENVRQMVYACGIFIGLYARTGYGRAMPADGIAVTELEFNYAHELKKPMLIFIQKLKDAAADPRQEEFLGRVLEITPGTVNVVEFENAAQLEHQAAVALKDFLIERFHLVVTQPPFQAPRDLDTFVGREATLRRVIDLLAPGKPVIIYGRSDIGGLGKSVLATHLAHQLRDAFYDGVLWADIPTTRPSDVLATWASEFGGFAAVGRGDLRFVFRPLSAEARELEEVTARVEALRDLLRGKHTLAILDGVVDEIDESKIAPLLQALSDSTVIVTSRSTQLPFLPSATAVELERMTDNDAWDLFTRIVGAGRWVGERARVTQIGRAVDFLPLALNVTACLLRENKGWTLQVLVDRLITERNRLEARNSEYRTARGMQTALHTSYEHLRAEEKRFFSTLGAFAGIDFDVSAATFVAETAREDAERMLERLLRLSLIQEGRQEGRYKLHSTVRAFARDKAENQEVDLRMATYYCDLAREKGKQLQGVESHHALATLHTELSNITSGHQWARAHNHPAAWELCRDYAYGAMTYYFSLKAMWSDWISWSTIGIDACQKLGDERAASSIAGSLGMVYYHRGELEQAIELYKQALAIMEKLGHLRGMATIHMNLGNVQTEMKQWKEAIESHAKSMQLHERLGDLRGLAQARANLGMLYAKYGDVNKARANWIQALEMLDHLDARREADIVRKWLESLPPPRHG